MVPVGGKHCLRARSEPTMANINTGCTTRSWEGPRSPSSNGHRGLHASFVSIYSGDFTARRSTFLISGGVASSSSLFFFRAVAISPCKWA